MTPTYGGGTEPDFLAKARGRSCRKRVFHDSQTTEPKTLCMGDTGKIILVYFQIFYPRERNQSIRSVCITHKLFCGIMTEEYHPVLGDGPISDMPHSTWPFSCNGFIPQRSIEFCVLSTSCPLASFR